MDIQHDSATASVRWFRACEIWLIAVGLSGAGVSVYPGQVATTPLTVVAPTNMVTEDSAFGSGTLRGAYRIQLVYGAAQFPTGALLITELRFRPDYQYGEAFSTTLSNFQVSLSTTPVAPDGLSTTFAQNVGPDETVVFSGPLRISSAFTGPPNGPKAFDIVIPLTTPFVYAPAAGSLLVDLRNYVASTASRLSGQSRPDDFASRLVGVVNADSGGTDSGAEAIQITYFPTNEPPLPPPRVVRGPYLQTATTSNIVVRWRTSRASDSRVRFGLAADALGWEVSAEVATNEHIVTLTNLAADSRYFYAIGTSQTNLAGGADHYFFTLPTAAKPTRIWAIGDSGTANQFGYQGQQEQVRDAYYAFTGSRETDVWLMLGDNAYLHGWDSEYQETVFDIYPTLLRRTVVWPTIGNHEVYEPVNFAYLDIFSLPTQGEAGGIASGTKRYYSFDSGGIHFVCLDSENSDLSPGGPMLTWLEQDLAASTNDWLIAFWHRPPYSFSTHNSDVEGPMILMRENAVPILENYGVDLVLCGHSHSFERSVLLDGHYGDSTTLTPAMIKDAGSGQPEDTGAYRKATTGLAPHEGAVYVVCGSSGWVTPDTLIPRYLHPAMFIKLKELGSLVIDVSSNRLDALFLRETGVIDDHFTILKGASPEPFRLATFRVNGGSARAQWKSVAGQSYRVERTPSLENPDWKPASGDIAATGATTGWTNAVPAGEAKCFYRVVRLPP